MRFTNDTHPKAWLPLSTTYSGDLWKGPMYEKNEFGMSCADYLYCECAVLTWAQHQKLAIAKDRPIQTGKVSDYVRALREWCEIVEIRKPLMTRLGA